jgi:hypothetical protein
MISASGAAPPLTCVRTRSRAAATAEGRMDSSARESIWPSLRAAPRMRHRPSARRSACDAEKAAGFEDAGGAVALCEVEPSPAPEAAAVVGAASGGRELRPPPNACPSASPAAPRAKDVARPPKPHSRAKGEAGTGSSRNLRRFGGCCGSDPGPAGALGRAAAGIADSSNNDARRVGACAGGGAVTRVAAYGSPVDSAMGATSSLPCGSCVRSTGAEGGVSSCTSAIGATATGSSS